MPENERTGFGIPLLDEALCGGIPEKNIVLISGGAGTGKSTLCLHFVLEGIKKGERTLYISTEQKSEEMERQAEGIDNKFAQHIQLGKLKYLLIDVLNEETFLEKINKEISDFKPKRVVIDSLSTFSEFAATTDFARQLLLKRGGVAQRNVDLIAPTKLSEKTISKRLLGTLIAKLRAQKITVLMTSELSEKSENLSSDGISEFLADGVILLHYFALGEVEERVIKIRKMRYSGHETKPIQYALTSKGIEIKREVDLGFR